MPNLRPPARVHPPPPPPPPGGPLDPAITQQEIELALPSFAMARLLAGLTGQQSSYDMQHDMQPWTMAAVERCESWHLFLHAVSITASMLPCISSALVTPKYKKVYTLDAATNRPIAVGEPLHMLYTIILKRRLGSWYEEHQLCSPPQAGLANPIYHLRPAPLH